ncbi:MAG: DNA polymerase III subunit alpha [Myxococcales bacterium]|jgi:DNA polymerase-3 subunit alpha|nr:DNA polymerase III subunit alpha [Myxococcales bacterium]
MPADFTHLHLHTLYSLLDGAIRIKDLVKTVGELGMDSVAITDHGNMFGAIDFYKQAKAAGIKPIIGTEAYTAPDRTNRTERVGHHLVLLAKDAEGYANLRYLSSQAYIDGFYYHPRIDKPLLAKHAKGLVCCSACLGGEVPQHILNGKLDAAKATIEEFKTIFGPDNYFLEIQPNGLKEQVRVNDTLKQLSRDTGVPLVATNDCHYVKKEHARAQEILMCISSNKTLKDENRIHHESAEYFIKSPAQMAAYFADVPEAIENTVRIAQMCNLDLALGNPRPPSYKPCREIDGEGSEAEIFVRKSRAGLEKRFEELRRRGDTFDPDRYRERLEREIEVIERMGFAGYFLIVQDFINWAKNNGCPVGPGRGSGAGSIVAWSLRITDLDPMPYDLLFERFLNPERVSMPDFDVDFCQTNRFKVIDYVTGRYGRQNVGQIITYGSLKAKSVIKDVCRVMSLPPAEANRIAKLIPDMLGLSLKDAIFGNVDDPKVPKDKQVPGEPELRKMIDDPTPLGVSMVAPGQSVAEEITTKDLLEISMALEGLHRQTGMHAAGIVIGDKPLFDYVPIYKSNKGDDTWITQYAKEEVEDAGLVKFDFLGLKNLTIIQSALDLVNKQRPKDAQLKAEDLPLNDEAAFELMSQGDTGGIFQMESQGFTEMMKALRPTCFEDIIAAGALYRPGPLKQKLPGSDITMVQLYIERKHGRMPVTYSHPKLEPILEDTYGVIVYQEQVMLISRVLAGYSLGRADLLRRAMGKKKKEVMQKERAGFMEGALANGVDEKVADEIFSMMEKFAEYGFNKSHAAAYAMVTMQTAWLKAHHRVEFMAALLSSERDLTDKVVTHISEARSAGVEVLPPCINESDLDFSVFQGKIRFGLGGIKGVGEAAIEAILEARQTRDKGGPFKGLFDFCDRVDLKRVNKKVIEWLVKTGAFDFTKIERQRLFLSIDRAVERGQSAQRDRASGQKSLFGMLAPKAGKGGAAAAMGGEDYVSGSEWPEKERLQFEKEGIGFYISGHPLDQYRRELSRLAMPCANVAKVQDPKKKLTVAGIVVGLREKITQSGKKMAWGTLEDLTGAVDLVFFPSKEGGGSVQVDGKWQKGGPKPGFSDWEALLKGDEPLLIVGSIQANNRDEENPKTELIVVSVQSLAEVRSSRARELAIELSSDEIEPDKLVSLRALLEKKPGKLGVALHVSVPLQGQVLLKLPDALRVAADDALIADINELFGGKVAELG